MLDVKFKRCVELFEWEGGYFVEVERLSFGGECIFIIFLGKIDG